MGTFTSSAAHLRRHADLAGATTSSICIIHCLLTPVVISLFPSAIPYLPGDALFHRILAACVGLLGTAAFVPGYRIHRRRRLLVLIGTGMSVVLAVAFAGQGMSRTLELLLSISGSMMLVTAHLLNRSFCRQCITCSEHPEACHTTNVE